MIRYATRIGWHTLFRVPRQSKSASSSSAATVIELKLSPATDSPEKPVEEHSTSPSNSTTALKSDAGSKPQKTAVVKDKKSSIVAVAFANLKSDEVNESRRKRPSSVDERIVLADSVASLLSISESTNMSRRHALRIVSILADWTAANQIKLADFEADPRFIRLCRLLGRGIPRSTQDQEQDVTGFGDLAMVLGVTGDDEAAKLVAGISLSQMIRVMSTLALKRRRSTPLLRSLAFNIGRSEDILDVKQGADVLYAMAVLNFPDEALLERTCSNLCESVSENRKSAVTGSILTSIGRLRFKHTELLNGLSEWVVKNLDVCRSQEVVSLLLTLATVDHLPANADQLFDGVILKVTLRDMATPTAWLDVVWSLVILGRATASHINSVLSVEFVEKLTLLNPDSGGLTFATKLKLLNINAFAQFLMPKYKGPLLPKESDVFRIPIKRSKEKQTFVNAILDSLTNLLPSATYLSSNVDTGMGFVIDGECVVDAKCNPLPVTTPVADKKATRVSIIAWDYADMCRGSRCQPTGVASLAVRLLEAKGYRVLTVPHTEFNPREKLVTRVQYLEQQLKTLAKLR